MFGILSSFVKVRSSCPLKWFVEGLSLPLVCLALLTLGPRSQGAERQPSGGISDIQQTTCVKLPTLETYW